MRRFNHARLPLPSPPFLALNGTFQLVKWSPGELLVVGQWMSCTYIISFVCDHNTPSNTLKMGERLQSQKSYVCTFFDCKAKFSKSWKLEAHLCKHTGLVSAGAIKRWGFPKNVLQIFVFCCFWGSHVDRLAVTAEALLLWELQQELLHPLPTHQTWAQPQRGKAPQVSCSILFCDPSVDPFFATCSCSGLQVSCWRLSRGLCHTRQHEEPHGSNSLQTGETVPGTEVLPSLSFVLFQGLNMDGFLCFSVIIGVVRRVSTKGTKWKRIRASTRTSCLSSQWRYRWCFKNDGF